jgi:hypothetical protein
MIDVYTAASLIMDQQRKKNPLTLSKRAHISKLQEL